MKNPVRILLLDFSKEASQLIGYYTNEASWCVEEESTTSNYLRKVRTGNFDLCLIDTSAIQEGNWHCTMIKRTVNHLPVMLITDSGDSIERIQAFQAGADDCISKPISTRELIYRMQALLKRTTHHTKTMKASSFFTPLLNIKLEFDNHPHCIKLNQHVIKLTTREYEVLQYLARRKNKTVTREELLQSVWRTAHVNYLRTVDTTIKRIREKLNQKTPAGSFIIRTEHSRGYRFMDPSLETG